MPLHVDSPFVALAHVSGLGFDHEAFLFGRNLVTPLSFRCRCGALGDVVFGSLGEVSRHPLVCAGKRFVAQVAFDNNLGLARRLLCGSHQQQEGGPTVETIGLGGNAHVDGVLLVHDVVCCLLVCCCEGCVKNFAGGLLAGNAWVCGAPRGPEK